MILAASACALLVGAAAAQAPEGEASPVSQEVEGFRATQATIIAFENARIIDGTGAPPRDNQTLVVRDGRILAIGPTGGVTIPEGAERHSLAGHSILPGYVMLHEHMMYFSGQRVWHSQPVSYPRLYLAAGVTTVRTAGGDFPYVDLNLAARIASRRIAGPAIFVTSPNINGPDDSFIGDVVIRNADDARREVDYWAARGATSFKAYAGLEPDLLRAVVVRAHALGLPVTAHLGRTSCAQATELGIDNLEHSFSACLPELGVQIGPDGGLQGTMDRDRAQALIRALVDAGVVLTSTPMALEDPSPELRELLHPTALANWTSGRGRPPQGFIDAEPLIRTLERDFLAAGGRMVIGADAENFARVAGDANLRALELLASAGHRPIDIIRMATLEGARFLGIDGDTGTIAPGKQADLIVVRGDPARNISDVRQIRWVLSDGIVYDPVRLRSSVRGMVGWH